VDFELSADEVALAEGMRRLCAGRFPLDRVRAAEGEHVVMDGAGWSELADAGVFSLRLAEDGGGLGLPMAAAAVVFEELGRALAYGSRVGERLELSLLEAAYLCSTGQLTLKEARTGRAVPFDRLEARGRRLDPGFAERLAAYRELRTRQLVVKTGFKYGAHFRAYPRNPEHAHARYLVQAVPDAHRSRWPVVAGGVRVAQGVRKEFLLAGVGTAGAVRFLSLERIRP